MTTPERLMALADTVDDLSGFEIPTTVGDEIRLASRLWASEHRLAGVLRLNVSRLLRERNEARQVAGQLLRLARAYYAWDCKQWNDNLALNVCRSHYAMPPGLRLLVEE